MFSDTLTIHHGAGDLVYTRINQDKYSSEYIFKDGAIELRLNLRNTSFVDKTRGNLRVDRHNVEIIGRIWATGDQQYDVVRKSYAVFEIDSNDDGADAVDFFAGMVGFCTEANLTKLANFES